MAQTLQQLDWVIARTSPANFDEDRMAFIDYGGLRYDLYSGTDQIGGRILIQTVSNAVFQAMKLDPNWGDIHPTYDAQGKCVEIAQGGGVEQ